MNAYHARHNSSAFGERPGSLLIDQLGGGKMSRYKQIDTSHVKTYSIQARKSKVVTGDFVRPWRSGDSFLDFFQSLPKILKADDLRQLVALIVNARRREKPVIVLMGAHVIKVGLSPLLVDAMQHGIITALACNGACAIHDTELAYWGTTSEDVAEGLQDGSFGMAKETGEIINTTISRAKSSTKGFGEILGERILAESPPFVQYSLLASAIKYHVPLTVHVAIGTDIVHQQPNADGAAIGELSYRDFKIFAQNLTDLGDGGVVLHLGSSVIMPEVFLKALTVVRNLGHPAHGFVTANFDMIQHYRPGVNVVSRPNLTGGKGFALTGHHEIMIPLLFAAVKEKMQTRE